ncbi:MAG: ABC transporter permease [Thermoplasmata archaeon]|nr:ABC transporter permease [Thermoplasmata archaeon]
MAPGEVVTPRALVIANSPAARWRGEAPLLLQVLVGGSLLLLLILPIIALFTSIPLSAIRSAAFDSGLRISLEFTLLASALSLVVVVGLGVPLGYLLARRRFPGREVVESVVALPIVLPHLIGGLALFLLFAPDAPLGRLAISAGLPVIQTIWGVVLVMVYVSASYTVLASQVAFQSVDARVVEAARSLGASPSEAFASVSLPIAARGVFSGVLLSWARSISEIGGFLIVANAVYPSPPYGGPVTSPVSVYVYNLYQIGDLQGATAAAALLVLIAFAIFLVVRLSARHGASWWKRVASGT